MQTTPGRAKRTIKPPRRLYEEDDDAVLVARRSGKNQAKANHEQHFVEAVRGPPAAVDTAEVENQPLAVRAAQENHIPRSRAARRQSNETEHDGIHSFDDDFVDAGAVDAGDDSDASEMSKEMKGDHDVRIEDFDMPLMTESVEAAARKASTSARRVSNSATQQAGANRPITQRTSLLSSAVAPNQDANEKGTQPSASNRTSIQNGTAARKPMTKAAPPGSGTRPPAASPARPSTVKAAGGAHAPAVVRQNACNKYKEALVQAAQKLTTAGLPEGTEMAEPPKLAEAIELACHTAFGKASSITPAYRDKFRLLFFALKKNQDLCKRLLLSDLQPDQLMKMSKEEMDDARTTKLRQEVLEKSRKRVVLDDEAAAKFSTAANKAMANKELQEKETAEEKRQAEKREAEKLIEEARAAARAKRAQPTTLMQQHSLLTRQDSGPAPMFGVDIGDVGADADAEDDGPAADQNPDDMSLSISDGGAAGAPETGEEVTMHDSRPSGAIPDDMVENANANAARRSSDGAAAAPRDASPAPEYNPNPDRIRWVPEGATDREKTPPLADGRRAGGADATGRVAGVGETTAAAFAHVEDLAPLVLPSATSQAAGGAPGVRLWTGYVELPGEGTFRGEVQSLQGCGDLAAIVKGTIAVVGKLPSANLEDFFEQLTPSRSRTVTLGLLRLNHASMDELTRLRCKEMYDELKNSERCAVYKPHNEECYLIPASMFGTRLCATAHVAARPIHKPAIPTALQDFEFLLAHVHAKGSEGQELAMELSARLKKDSAWQRKKDRMKKGKEAKKQSRMQRREKAIRAQKHEDDHIKQFHEATSMVDAAAASAAIKAATSARDSSIPQPSDPRQRRSKPHAPSGGHFTPSHPTPTMPSPWADAPPPVSTYTPTVPTPVLPSNFAPTAAEELPADTGAPDFDIGESLSSLATALGIDSNPTQTTTDAPTTLPAPTAADEPTPDFAQDMPGLDDLMGILGAVESTSGAAAAATDHPAAAQATLQNTMPPPAPPSTSAAPAPGPSAPPMHFNASTSQPMHPPPAMDYGNAVTMSVPPSGSMPPPPPGQHMQPNQHVMHGQPGAIPYDPSRPGEAPVHPQGSQQAMHGPPTVMMQVPGQHMHGTQPMVLAPPSSTAAATNPHGQLPMQGQHLQMAGHVMQTPGTIPGQQQGVPRPAQQQHFAPVHIIPQGVAVSAPQQNMHVLPTLQMHAPGGYGAPQQVHQHDTWAGAGKRKHPPPPEHSWHTGDNTHNAPHQRRRMGEGRGGGGQSSRGSDDYARRGQKGWGGARSGGRERPGTHAPPPDLVGVGGPPPPPPRF